MGDGTLEPSGPARGLFAQRVQAGGALRACISVAENMGGWSNGRVGYVFEESSE